MDLALVAQQMRLDALAVDASRELAAQRIPHALLKGPTTARWLYDPPRRYHDVDMLVPSGEIERAADALLRAGVVVFRGGRVGEAASHALFLRSGSGLEVDLHRSLPGLPSVMSDHDTVWRAVAPHIVGFELDGASVPAFDLPLRCLVLALHAFESGDSTAQVLEDLRRAVTSASERDWVTARRVARALGVEVLLDEGLRRVGASPPSLGKLPLVVALKHQGAPGPAFGIAMIASAPWRRRAPLLWQELVPSPGLIRMLYPDATTRRMLLLAYARRWWRICRQMPGTVRALRGSRRGR